MCQIRPSARVTIPDGVVFEVLDGEAVVLNLATGIYFGLDPVGTRAWELMATLGDVEKVKDAMLAEYDVSPAVLDADLRELIETLCGKGLLSPTEETP